jgi:dTDP-4-amino-4,6-dideoxygalactose transaminase
MKKYIWSVVEEFEKLVANYAGAKYGIAVDSCTSAIFLSLMYVKTYKTVGVVNIPKFTYPSVPCAIIQTGSRVQFDDRIWTGIYELYPYQIIDSALNFTKDMYKDYNHPDSLYCVSFNINKILKIGKGGMILTDNEIAKDWLKKARINGRSDCSLLEDNIDMLGWNMYMAPEQAIRGIELLNILPSYNNPLKIEYPDLSAMRINYESWNYTSVL